MKSIFSSIGIFFLLVTNVQAKEFEIVQLSAKGKYKRDKVELEDLTSNSSFDGKYFKVVENTSSEAIGFDADDDLRLRAATVYYHLTKARKFFIEEFEQDGFNLNNKKLIIRVNQEEAYSEHSHFKNSKHLNEKTKKNVLRAAALTIDSGMNPITNESWDEEIWFFKKEIFKEKSRISKTSDETNMISNYMIQGQLQNSLNSFLVNLRTAFSYSGNLRGYILKSSLVNHAVDSLSTIFMYKGIEYLSKSLKWIKHKRYIDTALIPEVVYHEYTHFALKDFFELTKSTHLNEGFANYYAKRISKNKKIVRKKRKVSSFQTLNSSKLYVYSDVLAWKGNVSHHPFTLSLLTELEEVFGEEGTKILDHSTQYFNSSDSLEYDFFKVLAKAIDDISTDPELQKVRLTRVLRERGL